jgi:hypothetical protein
MPMAARPPGPQQTAVMRSGDVSKVGNSSPLEVLLPSSGALVPAPAPAPHRALALDALRIRRCLRDPHGRAARWAEPAFAREVELVRLHLAPLRRRSGLTASYGREAFQTLRGEMDRGTPELFGAVRVAYALRWVELGDGRPRPPWPKLLEIGAA